MHAAQTTLTQSVSLIRSVNHSVLSIIQSFTTLPRSVIRTVLAHPVHYTLSAVPFRSLRPSSSLHSFGCSIPFSQPTSRWFSITSFHILNRFVPGCSPITSFHILNRSVPGCSRPFAHSLSRPFRSFLAAFDHFILSLSHSFHCVRVRIQNGQMSFLQLRYNSYLLLSLDSI